jgi:pilus assembly protein CpaE
MTSLNVTRAEEEIRVLIVAGPEVVDDWMADVIKVEPDMTLLGLVRSMSEVLPSAEQLKPDVVLVHTTSGILDQGDLINRLSAPITGPAIIVVAMQDEVEAVRRAMLHGAQGFLLKPFTELDLLTSVRQAHELTQKRLGELGDTSRLLPEPKAGLVPQAEIVAVFSPKGGVGCTTIAVNLAMALRMTTGKPVILVDGDLRFGDVDTALNITSKNSIGTLLPSLDQLDDETLRRALPRHESGIQVVTAPPYLDTADAIAPGQLKQLLVRLSRLVDGYVVVDTWSSLDDCTLTILDACQHLMVVTTPQVMALRDTHRFLEVLRMLGHDPRKTLLILNQCYLRSDFKLKDVERALGQPVAQVIDHAPSQVVTSLNRGVPLVQEYQSSQAAKDIVQLARLLAGKRANQGYLGQEAQPVRAAPERASKRGFAFWNRSATAKEFGV